MPKEIDMKLGRRIVNMRKQTGMNQTELGRMIGVTFQQIQKYESGANRVSVSRLWDIAKAFDVPASSMLIDLEAVELSTKAKVKT